MHRRSKLILKLARNNYENNEKSPPMPPLKLDEDLRHTRTSAWIKESQFDECNDDVCKENIDPETTLEVTKNTRPTKDDEVLKTIFDKCKKAAACTSTNCSCSYVSDTTSSECTSIIIPVQQLSKPKISHEEKGSLEKKIGIPDPMPQTSESVTGGPHNSCKVQILSVISINPLSHNDFSQNAESFYNDDRRDRDYQINASETTSTSIVSYDPIDINSDIKPKTADSNKDTDQPLSETEFVKISHEEKGILEENFEIFDPKPSISESFTGGPHNSCNEFSQNTIEAESSDNDDSRDRDYQISDPASDTTSTSSVSSDAIDIKTEVRKPKTASSNKNIDQPLSETVFVKKNRLPHRKINRCNYCDNDVLIKNFVRHLERHHYSEKDVRDMLALPTKSKQRRIALHLLRNNTNFELFVNGTTRPNRTDPKRSTGKAQYYPCVYCKGLFLKSYLKRHAKSCKSQDIATGSSERRINHISHSMTITACAMDPTNVISRLNVKEQVFNLMKGDDIAFEAKRDLLIVHFGNSYLMKHKRERMAISCSNRMRELARLLISYRRILNKGAETSFKDLLHPENFDNVVTAVRHIVGYDFEKKTFKAPSLAMHLGTSLKMVCDELTHLILKQSKGFKCKSTDDSQRWLQDIKNFKKLVISRWNTEISSLANKDLLEKRWQKPLLLPLVSDVKKFRDGIMEIARECQNKFHMKEDNEHTYKLLVQCTLSLLIVFNRRRIGDVQYLKIKDYTIGKKSNIKDFENALTEMEKALTTKYKRVVTGGKGSRPVVILIPELIQNFMGVLLEHREKYIPNDNEYAFAMPGSKIKWGKGDVAIRNLATMVNLEAPAAITSNKLRKHIATIMQLLNLSKDEAKQFSTFMGHTQKTHDEFYELPVDLYQTAKVSKLLLMMEKGRLPLEYKGKSLAEINIDPDLEYAEEDNVEGADFTPKAVAK
ncbi:uncharacterized protein LOC116180961 [Photinus pyralis]|uniref:uncharacterized protein LOC116180961 n=1 Tax=Photinus pyralis TaxID=7054 RepID=UPI001266F13E|nr:uncharacterized protein LOC116180961 [Photinus pyralis]